MQLPDDHIYRALRRSTQTVPIGSYTECSFSDLESSQETYSSPPRRRTIRVTEDEEDFEPSSSQESDFKPSQEDRKQLDILNPDVRPSKTHGGYISDEERIVEDDEDDDTIIEQGHLSQSSAYGSQSNESQIKRGSSPHSDDSHESDLVSGTIFNRREMGMLVEVMRDVSSPNQLTIVKHAVSVLWGVDEAEVFTAYRFLNLRKLVVGILPD